MSLRDSLNEILHEMPLCPLGERAERLNNALTSAWPGCESAGDLILDV